MTPQIRPDGVAQRPHWGTYFPGIGRPCGIVSPQGVPFHVIRYAR